MFITTYALVLPAITMESEAACGIEAHQHDESCYEERLICNIPESDGHKHTADCYSTTQKLICDRSEHLHTSDCYDEEGNLTCSQEEHQHGEECYEEIQELICGLEESEGHHHDSSCYEKVLTCEKEVHTHSPACYREDAASVAATEHSAIATTTTTSADDAAMDETANASGTFDPAETAAEGYVPTLDELDFRQLLNDYTTIYYHRPEDSTEDSGQITDWQKVDEDTVLGETDILRVYLAYTIPAGSLNETNATARYRLPGNLHLTDEQMEAINQMENGLSGLYVDYDTLQITDTEKHSAYLGAEAVDGLRTPDQKIEDYLSGNNDAGEGEQTAQEIISAVVKADQVYDEDGVYGKKGAYLGTDLVLTFSPYTIIKNRNEYDSEGTPVKAGESVSGWFTLDFNMDQVDWDGNTAEITFVSEDNDLNTSLVSMALKKADLTSEETPQETDPSSEESSDSNNSDDEKTFDDNSSTEENKAETVEETHPAVNFEDSLTVHTGNLSSDTDAGNLPNSSKMAVSVSAEAGTFPAGTTMVLSAVTDLDAVAEAVEGTVESKTCGFQAVDISFRDKDGNEIEPLKPISVTMRSDSIKAATEDSSIAPVVVHVEGQNQETAEAGDSPAATVIDTLPDTTGNKEHSEMSDTTNSSDSISFESDAFSVYAIVYTVDFEYKNGGENESKICQYSIEGGTSITLSELVEVLSILDDTNYENTDAFLTDVNDVTFSNKELIFITRLETEKTVGQIIEEKNISPYFSADVSTDEVPNLMNKEVAAGDWVLISLDSFDSEETLTITMVNGEKYIVKVTDDRDYSSSDNSSPLRLGSSSSSELSLADVPAITQNDVSKTLTPNNDGTYTLKLSVKIPEIEVGGSNKANVVIIYDSSNSMAYYADSESVSYEPDPGKGHYTKIDGSYYLLAPYKFFGADGFAACRENDSSKIFRLLSAAQVESYGRYKAIPDRMDVAKECVNELGNNLLNYNSKFGDGTVEIGFVEFGTTVRQAQSPTTSKSTFAGWVDSCFNYVETTGILNHQEGGTNWEAALEAANSIQFSDDDPTYIVFVSDGNPTARITDSTGGEQIGIPGIYGDGLTDDDGRNFAQAQLAAQKILGDEKILYSVGIYGDANKMSGLASGDKFYYYDGTDRTAINAAFDGLVSMLSTRLGYNHVKITDGITGLTSVKAVDGKASDFVYEVIDKDGHNITAQVPASQKNASFTKTTDGDGTESGKVIWDMGDGLVINGATYSVSFVVWPDQDAYDLVADLNNGKISYNQLTDVQKKQITGSAGNYTLKTNTSADVKYTPAMEVTNSEGTKVTSGDEGTLTLPEPSPMPLTDTTVNVKKHWDVSLAPGELQEFLEAHPGYKAILDLKKGEDTYIQNIQISPVAGSYDWPDSEHPDGHHIATGLMVSAGEAEESGLNVSGYRAVTFEGKTYYVLEDGHDYQFIEHDIDYHFELENKIFHPMVVDGEKMDVTFVGHKVTKMTKLSTLTAVNTLKGGINIQKLIVNKNGNDIATTDIETEFVIHGSVVKNGQGTTLEYRLYGEEYTDEKGESGRSTKRSISDSKSFSITMHAGDYIRFGNLPSGYSYTFYEEDLGEDSEYSFYSIKGNATNSEGSHVEGSNISVSADGKTLSGTTVQNAAQDVVIRNKAEQKPPKLKVVKLWNDNLYSVNRPESVNFNILKDGTKIGELTLTASDQMAGDSYRWEAQTNIELIEGAVYTLEEHIPEEEISDYHYDFDTESIKVVVRDEEIILEGDTNADGALTAANHMRGSVTVTKHVVDQEGNKLQTEEGYDILPDAGFTFKLYLKDKEGNAISGKTSSDEEAIWYRLLDDDGTQLRDSEGVLIPDAVINNGDTFTLKAGQSLRLLNVPVGTKYKIEEITVPNGYEHMGPDQYTYMDASLVSQDKTVDGDEYYSMLPNTWDSVSVTNKYKYANIAVRKVDANDTTQLLSGAKFKLCTDAAGTTVAKDSDGNDFAEVTTVEGIAAFDKVPDGTYYLIETKAPENYTIADPIEVTVEKSKVSYRQASNVLSVTGAGIIYDATSNCYQLTVIEGPEEGQSVGTTDGTRQFSLDPHKRIDYLGDGGNDSDALTIAHKSNANAQMDLYRLYLDATMKKKTTHANIIFVEDWSSSMFRDDMGGGSRYDNMVSALTRNNGFVDSVLQTGSGNALSVVKFSDWRNTHYSTSDGRTLADGTGVLLNWTTAADTESANNAIKSTVKADINVTRRRHPDNTDGKQTQAGGTDYSYWTNYTAGLQMIENQIAALPEERQDYPVYVFFMSDGLPTSYGTNDVGGYIPNWVGQTHWINPNYTEPAHNNAYVWGKEVYQNLVTMNNRTGVLEATHDAIDAFKEEYPNLVINAIGFAGNMSSDISADNFESWHKGYDNDLFPKRSIANQAGYQYPSTNGNLQYNSVLRYLADGRGSYAEASNGNELAQRLNELLAIKSISGVSISDTLSDYVELYMKSPDFAVIKTTTNSNGTTTATKLAVSDNGNNTYTVKNGSVTIGTIVWNPTARRVALNFADDFSYEDGDKYELSFNVEASSKAYEEHAHRGYGGEKGDQATDYGNNTTSEDAEGFFANKIATVSYKYGQETGNRTEYYPYPVIQVGTTKLEIQKEWDPEAPSGESTIRFNLYAQKPGGSKVQIMNPDMPDGSFIVRASEGWKLTIDKLNPKVLSNAGTVNAVYEPIIYTVEEVGTYESYTTSYEYLATETPDKSSFTNITSHFLDDGNVHQYYVPEVSETSEGGQVKILNSQQMDFTFTKIWRDPVGTVSCEWPSDKTITAIIRQDNKVFAKYKISDTVLALNAEISAFDDTQNTKPKLIVVAADASGYTFKLNGLPHGHAYTVSEEAVDGYQSPKYFEADGKQVMGAQQIGDGGTISNDQAGYELPSTGGSGTKIFTILGSILILGAGVLLWRRGRFI